MNKFKKVLIIAAATLATLFLAVSFVAWLYKDKVKALVVAGINENLKAEIEVGAISFSFFSHFPYASVDFENVRAKEPKGFETTGTIMNAQHLSLLFSITDIFRENYRLKKIVLTDASLNLQVAENGETNYEIWKSDSTATGKQFHLELQDVEFKNVDVLYYNTLKKQDLSFYIENGQLSGDFGSAQYTLSTKGKLKNATVIIDEVTYLANKSCELSLALDVNDDAGSYVFKNSEITLSGLQLQLTGTILDKGDYLTLDLKTVSPQADLPALLSVIPEKYKGSAKGYRYSGKVEFTGTFKGKSDARNNPLVNFRFTSHNVSLNPEGTPYYLKQLNCDGFFTNRRSAANPVEYLELNNFSALLEGRPVKATIAIENFSRPKLNAKAIMEADLNALSRFFKPDTIAAISGKLFVDAAFKGVAGDKASYHSEGSIRFADVSFRLKNKPVAFSGFNGNLHLEGNDLVMDEMNGKAGNSDFKISGTFKNLFAWLLLEKQNLDITATLQSAYTDLDEIMARDQSKTAVEDTVYRLDFSNDLRFLLQLNIRKLKFRKFQAEAISGSLALQNKVLMTRLLDLSTVGGTVRLKGQIDSRPADSLKIDYDALVNDLDINNLFYEMGNFGQEVLIDKNLKGRVKAEVQFRSTWSKRLEINESSIYSKSDITIENGELINFEPMLALSKYVKGADLKVIKFSTLTNTIEIRDRVINIPLMEIKSSALDIIASGRHTFDNIVDYNLRLYLSQLVGRKVKEQNTEFGTIEDDGLGRTMLYLTMKGNAADPKFAIDRKSVENKITNEIKKETKSLKNILKEEFGKKDPAINDTKKDQPKKQEELQIEFDE